MMKKDPLMELQRKLAASRGLSPPNRASSRSLSPGTAHSHAAGTQDQSTLAKERDTCPQCGLSVVTVRICVVRGVPHRSGAAGLLQTVTASEQYLRRNQQETPRLGSASPTRRGNFPEPKMNLSAWYKLAALKNRHITNALAADGTEGTKPRRGRSASPKRGDSPSAVRRAYDFDDADEENKEGRATDAPATTYNEILQRYLKDALNDRGIRRVSKYDYMLKDAAAAAASTHAKKQEHAAEEDKEGMQVALHGQPREVVNGRSLYVARKASGRSTSPHPTWPSTNTMNTIRQARSQTPEPATHDGARDDDGHHGDGVRHPSPSLGPIRTVSPMASVRGPSATFSRKSRSATSGIGPRFTHRSVTERVSDEKKELFRSRSPAHQRHIDRVAATLDMRNKVFLDPADTRADPPPMTTAHVHTTIHVSKLRKDLMNA